MLHSAETVPLSLIRRYVAERGVAGLRLGVCNHPDLDSPVARLVPEAPRQDALEVFGDLYRTLDEATATALSTALSSGRKGRRRRVSELRNPWAG